MQAFPVTQTTWLLQSACSSGTTHLWLVGPDEATRWHHAITDKVGSIGVARDVLWWSTRHEQTLHLHAVNTTSRQVLKAHKMASSSEVVHYFAAYQAVLFKSGRLLDLTTSPVTETNIEHTSFPL